MVDVYYFFQAGLGAKPDDLGFRRNQLQTPRWIPSVDRHNTPLQSVDVGFQVIDSSTVQQLRVISIQMMTEMETVDESYQIFRIGGEFLGSKNTALGHIAAA